MSHPTCCSVSLGRCDRCDLLVDLEGFHLVCAARRECALVLDIESCDRCAGYPGYGVNRSRSRARGGGGDRRALGQGPARIRWHNTALDMPRNHLPDGAFLEHDEKVRAPRTRLGVRAIRQLRFEAATIAGLARHWQPRGTPCGPISSRACKPHLNPARFAGVRVPRVDERRVAPPRPTPTGPTSSPASRPLAGRIIPRPA